jgi:hypothetical protein
MKNSHTPLGSDPATFRLAEQSHNQLRYRFRYRKMLFRRRRRRVGVKDLGHLLTHSGLTQLEVSSLVFLASLCL